MTKIYGLSTELEPEKIVYIGKTLNKLNKRLTQHKAQAIFNKKNNIKCNKLHNWILKQKKLGIKILITQVDEVEDDFWKFYETEYIKLFKSFGADLKNTSPGGDIGSGLSGDEHPLYRKIGSGSTAFKILRKTREVKELKSPRSYRKGVNMLDINTGKILRYFEGTQQAADFVGGCDSGIYNICIKRPGFHTYYGHKWEFTEKPKYIKQIDTDGNIINSFSTYQEAADSISSSHKGIWKAQKEGHKYKGFYWEAERPNFLNYAN